jgi:hypothetical protein
MDDELSCATLGTRLALGPLHDLTSNVSHRVGHGPGERAHGDGVDCRAVDRQINGPVTTRNSNQRPGNPPSRVRDWFAGRRGGERARTVAHCLSLRRSYLIHLSRQKSKRSRWKKKRDARV